MHRPTWLQLRCGGVLEAVRISCAGYPTKIPYEDFVDHFWNLATDMLQLDDIGLTKGVLQRVLGVEGYQLGKSKVGGGLRGARAGIWGWWCVGCCVGCVCGGGGGGGESERLPSRHRKAGLGRGGGSCVEKLACLPGK